MSTGGLTPRDLPDLRLRMAQFWDNPANHMWVHVIDADQEPPAVDEQRELAGLVRASLADGEVYHVAPELVAIMAGAELAITDYGFMPWDLPSPAGFMYLDGGMHLADGKADPFVLSWITCQADESAPHGILQLFIHAPKDDVRREALGAVADTTRFDQEQADFVLANAAEVVFAEAGEAIEYRTHHQEMGVYVLSLLFSACHLMRQTLAETAHETPERGARRRHQRAGLKSPDIRVVQLRHSERRESTGESGAEWRHRWIVRGHWRKQWYPSIQAHRPVWIAPFVKGPKDAPLLGGEKVYRVNGDGGEPA